MPRTKVNDYPQMKLRLSPELKAMIDEAAKTSNRTLNAEIITRLEETFSSRKLEDSISEKVILTDFDNMSLEQQAFVFEKARQAAEEAKRTPTALAEEEKRIADEREENHKKSPLTARLLESSTSEKERHLKNLKSEADLEKLIRKSVGAIALRKLDPENSDKSLYTHGDKFKIKYESMGLRIPLQDSSDIGKAIEDTVVRISCTIINDVLKEWVSDLVKEEIRVAVENKPPPKNNPNN